MYLFNADAKIFKKKNLNFFCPQKVGKTTLKSCSELIPQIHFFFPYCPDCPNGPNRGIPVLKCDLLTNCIYRTRDLPVK